MTARAYGIHVAEDGPLTIMEITRSATAIKITQINEAKDLLLRPARPLGCDTCKWLGVVGEERSGGHKEEYECMICKGVGVDLGSEDSSPCFMVMDAPRKEAPDGEDTLAPLVVWNSLRHVSPPWAPGHVVPIDELLGDPPEGLAELTPLFATRSPESKARPAARLIAEDYGAKAFLIESRPWVSLLCAGCSAQDLALVAQHQDRPLGAVLPAEVRDAAERIGHWLDNSLGLDVIEQKLAQPAHLAAIACALTASCMSAPMHLQQPGQQGWRLVLRGLDCWYGQGAGPAIILFPAPVPA